MGSTVELVFAGDSAKLEKAFDNVGEAAKDMGRDLDKVDTSTKGLSTSMSGVGSVVDSSESKFMGTADVLDGLNSVMGTNFEAQINMARGFGDIAGGLTNLGPMFGGIIGKVGAMIGVTSAQTAATGTATGAQWSLNAALAANPIGAVVIAIGLLVGGFILAWKHSETFRDVVRGALDVVKKAAMGLWDFFRDLPGLIYNTGGKIVEVITWPYRTAFNAIAKLWNSTVGKLSFEVPSWVPGIGGKGFSMPNLPTFHTGGVVPGPRGSETAILAMAGETVTPAGGGSGAGGPIVIQLVLDGRVVTEVVHNGLLAKQRRTPLGLAS